MSHKRKQTLSKSEATPAKKKEKPTTVPEVSTTWNDTTEQFDAAVDPTTAVLYSCTQCEKVTSRPSETVSSVVEDQKVISTTEVAPACGSCDACTLALNQKPTIRALRLESYGFATGLTYDWQRLVIRHPRERKATDSSYVVSGRSGAAVLHYDKSVHSSMTWRNRITTIIMSVSGIRERDVTSWLESNLPVLEKWIKFLPRLQHIEFVVTGYRSDSDELDEILWAMTCELNEWRCNYTEDDYSVDMLVNDHNPDNNKINFSVNVKPSFEWASLYIYPSVACLPMVLLSIVHEYYTPQTF